MVLRRRSKHSFKKLPIQQPPAELNTTTFRDALLEPARLRKAEINGQYRRGEICRSTYNRKKRSWENLYGLSWEDI